jgi:hypothetical protein
MNILMHLILSRSSYLWPCILTTFHEIILFMVGQTIFSVVFHELLMCFFHASSLNKTTESSLETEHLKKSMLT